jgi:Uma2 family endonuclease
LGVLAEDARVELIGGQVVEMSPIGDRHANCVRRLIRAFAPHVDVAIIDVQSTLVLGEHDAPQPDLTVLKPRADAYLHHPRPPDTLLVIEVADSSLAYDHDVKVPRYAGAGIPEVWLVDVVADAISVYRGPGPDGYSDIVTVARGDIVRPLRLPGIALAVDEILG